MFGLQVYNENAELRLNVTDRTARIAHSQFIGQGESSSVNLPWYNPSKHVASLMYVGALDSTLNYFGTQSLSISGTTLSWVAASNYATGPSILVVIEYV